jgi:integrase
MSANFRIPSYRRHRQSGQAVVTLTDSATGRRRDVLLGKYGTAASKTEYKRVVLDWEANGRRLQDQADIADLTIAELIARYWEHVETYYRHVDGTPTGEAHAMKSALRPLNYLYGTMAAREFGPLAFKAVRELMVKGYDHPKYKAQPPLCRTLVNARAKRIRRCFKWAVENELVPPAVAHGLSAVQALKLGRTDAKESAPVLPVARAVVDDTLPLLRPMQADMVRLQLETGMRPGELVVMRACDLDTTGPVWLYRPDQHKTLHHGHIRIVPIGPKGQAIVRGYLVADLQAYLFSPARNMEERAATMRANRKTKVQPSQVNRKKAKRKRKPGSIYTVLAYGRAIAEAIKRHNACRPENEHIPHWHPHQLRHTRAMELKREAGLDVARAVLGHRSPAITEMYAGLDMQAAAEVMGRIG